MLEDQTLQPSDQTPEPAAQPAPTHNLPSYVDKERLESTAAFLESSPEARQYILERIGDNDQRLKSLELAFVTEQVMRKCGLDDDERDLIEAPTAQGILAKGMKLQAKKTALAEKLEDGKPKAPPEIVYPEHTFTPKNEYEAAVEQLRRMR
jgi:hypothetical protein